MLFFLFGRCTFSKINAVFKSLWAKKLTDYGSVSLLLKRFESGFVVKQAKTFTPQEVCFHFIKMFKVWLSIGYFCHKWPSDIWTI